MKNASLQKLFLSIILIVLLPFFLTAQLTNPSNLTLDQIKKLRKQNANKTDGTVSVEKDMGISVDKNYTPEELIKEVFISGGCFDVSNVTYTGDADAKGYFSSGENSINIEEGIILSSGDINGATGPNNSNAFSTGFDEESNDSDLLDAVSNSTDEIWDQVTLEFDFIPTTDMISFEYSFASEEYCEFAGDEFNDVFGFFISGPGINGPFSNNSENIALVPGTNQFVSINSINHFTNEQYYMPNERTWGAFSCFKPYEAVAENEIEYDGFTTVLTALANVIPCETYHIKLTLGDGEDDIYDSAVFLKANSFNAGGTAVASANSAVTTSNLVYETCNDAYFVFERTSDNLDEDMEVTFTVSPSSTATEGLDYAPFPTSVTIPAGKMQVVLPIDIFADDITEGEESIIIELDNACSCTIADSDLYINESPILTVEDEEYIICESESYSLIPFPNIIPNGTQFLWSDGSTESQLNIDVEEDETYVVTITDQCGETTSANYEVIVTAQPAALLTGQNFICTTNQPAELQIDFEGTGPWEVGITIDGFPQSNIVTSDNPYIFTSVTPGTYQLTSVNTNSCVGNALGQVEIDQVNLSLESEAEMASCFNDGLGSIDLIPAGGDGPYTFNWANINGNIEDLTGLEPGNYEVTVTDFNGCTTSTAITINDEVAYPSAEVEENLSLTCFEPNVELDAIINGDASNLTIEWITTNGNILGNNNTLNPAVDAPGNYTLVISNQLNGCNTSYETSVTDEQVIPLAETSAEGILNCTTEELTLSLETFGASDLSYQWTTSNGNIVLGESTTNPIVNQAGIYNIAVTNDLTGCVNNLNIEVEQDLSAPEIELSESLEITCIQSLLNLNASVTSEDDFTIEWTTTEGNILSGEDSENPLIDAPGQYNIIATNEETGCITNENLTIIENVDYPEVEAGLTQQLDCNNTQLNVNASTSLSGNYDIDWSSEDGNILSFSTTLSPLVDEPGTYVLEITNNENGCTALDEVIITEDINAPIVDAGNNAEMTCIVDEIYLDGTAASSEDYSINWMTNNGNIVVGENDINPLINEPGTYTLLVINDMNGCTSSDEVVIIDNNDAPIVEAGNNELLTCIESEVQLEASVNSNEDFSFEWIGPNGIEVNSDDIILETDEPGIYILSVTNLVNGCTAQDQVEVTNYTDAPNIITGEQAIISCIVPNVSLNAQVLSTDIYTVEWTTLNGNILQGVNQVNPVVNEQGVYNVVATNSISGCTAVAQVSVQENTLAPVVEAGMTNEITCLENQLNLNGQVSTIGDYSVIWTTSNGNVLSDPSSLTPLIDESGSYTLIATNTENGCTSSDEVIISQNITPPSIDAGEPLQIDCVNSQIDINATIYSQEEYIFEWVTEEGNILGSTNTLNPIVNEAGIYTLIVTNTENGCVSEDATFVAEDTTPPGVQASVDGELTCDTEQLTLNGFVESDDVFEVEWSTSNGHIMSNENTLFPLVSESGIYTLMATNIENGCTAMDDVAVAENTNYPSLIQAEAISPICHGGMGGIEISGVEGGEGPYLFSIDNGTNYFPSEYLEELPAGDYNMTVQDINGCELNQQLEIPQPDPLQLELENSIDLKLGEDHQIQASTNLLPLQIADIQWTPAFGLSCDDCLNPTVIPTENTIYTLIITDEKGCETDAQIQFRVSDDIAIFIPNAFSPQNGDGTNDRFKIYPRDNLVNNINKFFVFDRWGQQVYGQTNISPNNESYGWDGTANGEAFNPGVFAYIIEVEYINGKTQIFTGDITLVD